MLRQNHTLQVTRNTNRIMHHSISVLDISERQQEGCCRSPARLGGHRCAAAGKTGCQLQQHDNEI